jgi:CRISPR-associated protein (TIGR03986 family)
MSVNSTYNFVPAPTEAEVYKPNWSNKVSHDIPFSDGESGEIELKITAMTPIFIRNGHSKNQETNEFSHYFDKDGKKHFFIPGSSLKGMLRNVLEIMSFSRMRQINNHKHSIRQTIKKKEDVINEDYTLGKEKKNILAGFFREENGKYFIYNCGSPLKIRYTDLDAKLKTNFGTQFGPKNESNSDKNFSARTGAYKYENIIIENNLEHKFINHPLDEDKQSSWKSEFQPLNYVKFAENETSFDGTIVCVGQASTYDISTARRGEYVFKGKKEDLFKNESQRIEVSKDVVNTFLFVNKNGKGKNEELKDWTYWKTKIDKGIPVFFRKSDKKDEKGKIVKTEIIDFGLTFMYKEPVKFSTIEANPVYKKPVAEDYKFDLSQIIFGYAEKEKTQKGRVFVSNFLAKKISNVLDETSLLLGSPRSSFTPFYLVQKHGKNGITDHFNTYNSNPTLRGFKRYPVHQKIKQQNISDLNSEMLSKIRPLDKDSEFIGKIRFHNLRKAEIGALLSAITMHNTSNSFHSIGLAKPFGYGSIKVILEKTSGLNSQINDYLKEFELEMKIGTSSWVNTVSELLTTSTVQPDSIERTLVYEDLKRFQEIKNKGLYLQSYSEISNNVTTPISLTNTEDLKKRTEEKKAIEEKKKQAQKQAEQDKRVKEIEEENAKKVEESNQYKHALEQATIYSFELFLKNYPLSEYKDEIAKQLSKLKAQSGIPDRLLMLSSSEGFFKETSIWIKKLPDAKLIGSGYEEKILETLKSIAFNELNQSKRISIAWSNGHNLKKLSLWIGQSSAEEWYNELKSKQ